MKTKEEILAKRIVRFPEEPEQAYTYGKRMTDESIKRNVYAAMDEYAKQQSMAFDRWKRINLYTFDIDTGDYIKLIIDGDNART